MRITIINGIEGYKNVVLDVPEWFCHKDGIFTKQANIIRQTEKALLLEVRGEMKWLPKSLIEVHPIPKGLGEWQ